MQGQFLESQIDKVLGRHDAAGMVARLVAVFGAQPQQQLKQVIRIGSQGGEQLVAQSLTVDYGACCCVGRSQGWMARAGGGPALRRIILTIQPALNRRGVST